MLINLILGFKITYYNFWNLESYNEVCTVQVHYVVFIWLQ